MGGLDWKGTLLESLGLTPDCVVVLQLRRNPRLSENQRAREFSRVRGKTERTYYRALAYLKAAGVKLDLG